VLLPEADPQTAQKLGERMLRSIKQSTIILGNEQVSISASMGIAGFSEAEHVPPHILLERADKILYQAKNSGRDRLCLWGDPADKVDPAGRLLPVGPANMS
jgi:diguanylate cyclase (GGDEF)-like protein